MIRLIIIILFGFLLCQESMNFNYESKYGNGTTPGEGILNESPYSYFENLLDINFSHKNLFLYTQLEYSNSPIYGVDRIEIKNLANTYNVEYSNSDLIVKYGHIQTLYGYGLSVNMFQDQVTNFDNRVKGWEILYSPSDAFDIFFISGEGNYSIKTRDHFNRIVNRINDTSFEHGLNLLGSQFYTNFGDISIIYSEKETFYKADQIYYDDLDIYNNLTSGTSRIAQDLLEFINNNYAYPNNTILDSKVNLNSINIGYGNSIGNVDLYIEYDANSYNKILRDDKIDGASKFLSISTELFEIDLLYEFKDYDMLYYMPITSNSPLVFNESSSVLISRNQHAINFSDEIGHQFEARFDIKNISFLMNLSMGRKHDGINWERNIDGVQTSGTYLRPSFSDLLYMDFERDLVGHNPFRDIYIEGSGWNKTNNIYYKLGYHSHYSYDDPSYKNYRSTSIPMQFVYAFINNNSFTCYYEKQQTKNLSFDSFTNTDKYEYMSLSYHIKNFGSLTYFSDFKYEELSNLDKYWTGWEISLELSSSMQFSIFQGSQKGGLVCANGICAVEPSFEDGTKMTFRVLF